MVYGIFDVIIHSNLIKKKTVDVPMTKKYVEIKMLMYSAAKN